MFVVLVIKLLCLVCLGKILSTLLTFHIFQLDSWSVIINGQVQVQHDDDEKILVMGDTFGVEPNLKKQYHQGEMRTLCDDCQV